MVCRQSIKTIFEIVLPKKLKGSSQAINIPYYVRRAIAISVLLIARALSRCADASAQAVLPRGCALEWIMSGMLPPKPCLREPKVINFDLVKITTLKIPPIFTWERTARRHYAVAVVLRRSKFLRIAKSYCYSTVYEYIPIINLFVKLVWGAIGCFYTYFKLCGQK